MPIPKHKFRSRDPDINELALKHATRHPNDKSGHILARMNRRWGRAATDDALDRAYETAKLLQIPTAPRGRRQTAQPNKASLQNGTATGRIAQQQLDAFAHAHRAYGKSQSIHSHLKQQVQGLKPDFVIIDEVAPLVDDKLRTFWEQYGGVTRRSP